MSDYYIDIEDFKSEVVRLYDKHLMETEHRGINCGELVYIEGLSESEARALLEECYEKLNELEQK